MIVLNNQANQHVSEPRVRNFYPKNAPLSSRSISSALTASQDNFFSRTENLRQSQQYNAKKRLDSNSFFPSNQQSQKHLGSREEAKQQLQSWYYQQLQQQPNHIFGSHQEDEVVDGSKGEQWKYQNQSTKGSVFFQQQTEEPFQLKDKLNEQRRQRYEVDLSVEALKSRVNLLQMEEQRTVQKMVDTQKKTIEIIANKTHHMDKLAEKNEQKLRQAEDIMKRQLELKQMREEKQKRDELMKKMRSESAQISVQRMKNLKEQYAVHQQMMASEMLMRKTQSYLTVKASERDLDVKKMQFQDKRKSLAHQLYTSKCKTEISKKTQSQLFYSELENKEVELLRKLQFSQNLQQSALLEMQKVSKTKMNFRTSPSLQTHANDGQLYYLSN